tara:strand:- start:21292 stop:22425 length:1134 start_codon:yes stop_codon:yes gene_type:complete
MELKIVTYIKEHGLDKAIADWKLKVRMYDKKLLLKYNQLESPFGNREVEECRGLVLEKDTWMVMCLGLTKFYNSAEGHAAKLDWDTARVLKKEDGSCCNLHYDWHKETWFAATTGTAEGEGEVNNRENTSFNDLFWETIDNKYGGRETFLKKLFVSDTYVFELTTPYNIVVAPHSESRVTLLTARNMFSLEEYSRNVCESYASDMGVPIVEEYDLNKGNVGHIMRTFENMPFSSEGYVVVDNNFNRIKIKNPAYVAAHYLKGRSESHHILDIVKSNEIDEFIATFAERKEEILMLDENYKALLTTLVEGWDALVEHKPKNITPAERKKFATKVFSVVDDMGLSSMTGLYFGLMDGKVESVEDYVRNMDNKRLYQLLK